MRRLLLTVSDLKRRAPGLALLMIYLYLGYHAFSGSQGLVRWLEQTDRAAHLQARLETLEARRADIQAEVDLLSAGSLDLDTLDVEARRTLFVARPGEITIWLDP
ncbi:MAG: septum formation initiator family protein [Pseudomonadota bacterium]